MTEETGYKYAEPLMEKDIQILKACNKTLMKQLVDVQAELSVIRELNVLLIKANGMQFPAGTTLDDYMSSLRKTYKKELEKHLTVIDSL